MIEFEKSVLDYMYQLMCESVGDVFEQLDETLVKEKRQLGWETERKDPRTIQFLYGPVTYKRTLMYDTKGLPQYPMDEFLGIRKRQRLSPYVEVKTAELASENTYRQTAKAIQEWTPIQISHQTVGNIVKKVGEAQSRFDEAMVTELEYAAELPEGKEVPFLMAEADGVLVRGVNKRSQVEVRHCIVYEGWEHNGKRVSLKNPYTIMSTLALNDFWDSVQAQIAHRYTLTHTKVITNSDGGAGYTAERFQTAFSQSTNPVLNQLDAFHVTKAITAALRPFPEWKEKVHTAVKEKDVNTFRLCLDTIESQLEEQKAIDRISALRSYLLNNWERIFDWREKIDGVPEGARGLGAMESHQRHVTFRMKKRGMHWGQPGAEAMVKVKQGMLNGTLYQAYLEQNRITERKRRERQKTIRTAQILGKTKSESVYVKQGGFALYAPQTSPVGYLQKCFR